MVACFLCRFGSKRLKMDFLSVESFWLMEAQRWCNLAFMVKLVVLPYILVAILFSGLLGCFAMNFRLSFCGGGGYARWCVNGGYLAVEIGVAV
ncbi:uncharacterized protein HKW66_Vig0182480 [Vigna angularis]|uniref:Uncharacterized protein n=1 Tax=Phaseolus angularis TaxID=3914 RepID=A0A8T0K3Y4_PHAAN|nr:uncharacterized protein HKW66_Vig0182480 [Vigna angularis]